MMESGIPCGLDDSHMGKKHLSVQAVQNRRVRDRKRNSKRGWDLAFAEKERERDRKRYPERHRKELLAQREQVQLKLTDLREELGRWQTANW